MKRAAAPLGASLVVLSSLFYASYGIWATLMGDFFGSFTGLLFTGGIMLLWIFIPLLLALRSFKKKDM